MATPSAQRAFAAFPPNSHADWSTSSHSNAHMNPNPSPEFTFVSNSSSTNTATDRDTATCNSGSSRQSPTYPTALYPSSFVSASSVSSTPASPLASSSDTLQQQQQQHDQQAPSPYSHHHHHHVHQQRQQHQHLPERPSSQTAWPSISSSDGITALFTAYTGLARPSTASPSLATTSTSTQHADAGDVPSPSSLLNHTLVSGTGPSSLLRSVDQPTSFSAASFDEDDVDQGDDARFAVEIATSVIHDPHHDADLNSDTHVDETLFSSSPRGSSDTTSSSTHTSPSGASTMSSNAPSHSNPILPPQAPSSSSSLLPSSSHNPFLWDSFNDTTASSDASPLLSRLLPLIKRDPSSTHCDTRDGSLSP